MENYEINFVSQGMQDSNGNISFDSFEIIGEDADGIITIRDFKDYTCDSDRDDYCLDVAFCKNPKHQKMK